MATAAAALAARARREIQHAFFSADAVRPDRAIAFCPDNGFEERQFARLHRNGAIHEERPGLYCPTCPPTIASFACASSGRGLSA